MKNRNLVIAVIILTIIAILSSFDKKETVFLNEEKKVTIKNNETTEEKELELEEYIIGVVAGEMPASFEVEALKAQAIAARSYAMNKVNSSKKTYDLVTDVSNQVYITQDEMKEKWQSEYDYYYNKIKDAVLETKGLVMKYNDEIISAYYFAMSNGSTEDVSLVFGESKDYLQSVDSSWDENVKNFTVETNITKEEFCKKLDISCNDIIINNIKRSETKRVNEITINNKTFKGTEVRSILNLRSTDFNIEINESIKITTKGYGHGVGMSQYGANEMAKNGSTYEEILKHYYNNIEISKI